MGSIERSGVYYQADKDQGTGVAVGSNGLAKLNHEGQNGHKKNFNLTDRLEAHRKQEAERKWEGSFAQYFEIAQQDPNVARLSHARIYDMVMAQGVKDGPNGREYNFFSKELFGMEKPLGQLVEYFSSAAKRLEVRKRILLLMGPVGGGKSTIVSLLKRGLEDYSNTDEGAVYAVKGCPMHEEPLHLIPEALRDGVQNDYGLYTEGDPCPVCSQNLKEKYSGKVEDVPVERVTLSEKERRGIGTFTPSDPKSQDISELTGSIDLSTIGEYGVESDPRAYRFDGELNVANRGLMEFVEMLKCDEKFLYGLLTLSQEQQIKTGRFSMIYADEVIIAHTNETEYDRFTADKRSEALQDRIIVVKVPYNLRVSDEAKIYNKLLHQSGLKLAESGKDKKEGEVHIAPGTLDVASKFAVLSRLEPSKKAGMTLMKKMKLYNGEDMDGQSQKDVKELQEETIREGMDGISPRYVINRLSNALIKDDLACLNPIDTLRALREGFEQHTSISREEKERLLNLIAEARKDYDESAKREVQRAFVYSYEDQARTLMNNYLDNIEASVNKTKLKDPVTEEELEPDEKLMRSIEGQIGVAETAKKTFREEILIRISSLARRGQQFDYNSHPRLREALEKKLFSDLKDIVKITTSAKTPNPEQQDRINSVKATLVEKQGYCDACAGELLRYVGTLLSR